MPRYSDERHQAVVAKLLPPYNQSVEDVAREEGISSATVYKWRKEARAEGRCLPDASDHGWSGADTTFEKARKKVGWVRKAQLIGNQ